MMATRRPGTVSAINRAIDAMNTKPRANPAKSKAEIVKDVRRFAKENGLIVSPNAGNEPLIGKGEWFKVFDSWQQAYDYFNGWKYKKLDHNLPYPWDVKQNPAPKTRSVRVVAANPVKRPKSLYAVWTAAADGIKHERLATFEKLSEARKYAQAYADSSGKKMIVETKAL